MPGGTLGNTFAVAPGRLCHPVRRDPALQRCQAAQRHRPDHRDHQRIEYQHQLRQQFSYPLRPAGFDSPGDHRRQRPGIDGVNNPDGPNGASAEAYLDVEWSGAVAPGATIDLVIAADTSVEQGLFLAAERAVYSNLAPVISISFGQCEFSWAQLILYVTGLWEAGRGPGNHRHGFYRRQRVGWL